MLSAPFGTSSHGMGTKRAVKELLKPLSGGVKQLQNSPEVLLQGKTVGVEIAGFLHRACRRGAKDVLANWVWQKGCGVCHTEGS